MITFKVNKKKVSVNDDPDTPLLWVLRDTVGLKGTKFGCGKAFCGACSVHVNDTVVRSCSFPVKYAEGKNITTIEGVGTEDELHPVQKAWIEEQVPQCGYCQSGFIMSTVKLLEHNPDPTDEDINKSITNLCRCGTYYRVRKAIHLAAKLKKS
ncbi:(2Fe-2S)-binding protein [Aquimarina sp. U1-2]|uniref:(2Fe-2S)-binding protein n=1 Tax=Aquimarina sp. U1-2 TaxID=2823141 RepID=UPI001AECE70D|nr:(2Fe-2S)-binding protein [Aquimarina sp. U1-2]MBP2831855.1 (2Fe-2S)-binding protein [Aquimarina sp. U1-2]